jgi:predicted transcriptional regulator
MNIRKSLAALVVAGTLVAGIGATAAFADTTPSPTPAAAAPAKTSHCDKAADRIAKAQAELTNLDARIAKLQQARAKAVAAHKDDLVKKIDARIDKINQRHSTIEARIDKVKKACNLT